MTKIYAGVGSRQTPANILEIMTHGAVQLSKEGWLLRSGHAIGADYAFEVGAGAHAEIHLPWDTYNRRDLPRHDGKYMVAPISRAIIDIAAQFHPVWDHLSDPVKTLMCRNVTIMLGENLDQPVDMVACWTPGGVITGGTGQALRMAAAYQIPVFNLGTLDGQLRLSQHLWPEPRN